MRSVDLRGTMLRCPGWVLAIVSGSFFGLGMGLFQASRMPLPVNILVSVVEGVLFGSFMGPLAARMNSRYLAAQGPLPRSRERAVRRAALRGPVPSDPDDREASLRVLDLRLRQVRRQWWGAPLFAGLGTLALWLAYSESRWWLLGALEFGGFLGLHLWLPAHLERRRALLSGDRPPPG